MCNFYLRGGGLSPGDFRRTFERDFVLGGKLKCICFQAQHEIS